MPLELVPEDGPLQLGAVRLPPGSRITPWEGDGQPAAWVTDQPLPDPGPAWSALSDMHQETGLAPILLQDEEAGERFFFLQPYDVAEVDGLDAARLLAMMWDGEAYEYRPEAVEPYGRRFRALRPLRPPG